MSVNFQLSDEQKLIAETAKDFAVNEIRPVAEEFDRDSTFPREIINKAWELGLMNTSIEEAYGGSALDVFTGSIIEEQFSWGCSGIATSIFGAQAIGANRTDQLQAITRTALMMKIPYYTTAAGALAAAQAIAALRAGELDVRPIQAYG